MSQFSHCVFINAESILAVLKHISTITYFSTLLPPTYGYSSELKGLDYKITTFRTC